MLETYTPEVVRAYVSSRLESVSVVLREGLDDPLDDVTVIQQQLDQVKICISIFIIKAPPYKLRGRVETNCTN